MALKPGVRTLGLRPELLLALMVLHDLYAEYRVASDFVITSLMDGAHSRGSRHYAGNGGDLRLPPQFAVEIVADAKRRLGDDYDVVLESDHIHVEYDPKLPY